MSPTPMAYSFIPERYDVELRHLRYFVAVAQARNFSRAAEALHVAQPPLSRQIQQLEAELGVALLDRRRPLQLTDAGRFLHEQARQVLERVQEMRSMTRRLGRREALLFGVGFVPSVLYSDLPEVIRRFREAHEDVEVVLSEMTTLEQMTALKEARIDIGFGRLRFDDPAVQREVLQEERLVAVFPIGHPLQQRSPPLSLPDLAPEPLILYPKAPRPSYADQVLSCYRDHGLQPRIAYEVREMQTALSLVAAGVGVCIVPSAVRRMKRDGLVYAELLGDSVSSPIIMSWRVGDQSHLLTRFREITRQSQSDRKLAALA